MNRNPKKILIAGPPRSRTSMILSGLCEAGATGLYEPWHPGWKVRGGSRRAHNSQHIPIWRKSVSRADWLMDNPDIRPHPGGNGIIAVKTVTSQHVSMGPTAAPFRDLVRVAVEWADLVILTRRDLIQRIGSRRVKEVVNARWRQWNEGGSSVSFQEGSLDVPDMAIRRAINAHHASLCLAKELVQCGGQDKMICLDYAEIPTASCIREVFAIRGLNIPFAEPSTEPHSSGFCPERFLSPGILRRISQIQTEMRDSPWASLSGSASSGPRSYGIVAPTPPSQADPRRRSSQR